MSDVTRKRRQAAARAKRYRARQKIRAELNAESITGDDLAEEFATELLTGETAPPPRPDRNYSHPFSDHRLPAHLRRDYVGAASYLARLDAAESRRASESDEGEMFAWLTAEEGRTAEDWQVMNPGRRVDADDNPAPHVYTVSFSNNTGTSPFHRPVVDRSAPHPQAFQVVRKP